MNAADLMISHAGFFKIFLKVKIINIIYYSTLVTKLSNNSVFIPKTSDITIK